MPRFVFNSEDVSDKLTGFSLQCKQCGSTHVTLDLDLWNYPSDSGAKVTVICDDCHFDEEIIYW